MSDGDKRRYHVGEYDFVLPPGFTNAVLTSSTFVADDRAVA